MNRLFLVLLFSGALTLCATEAVVERTDKLGFGFRCVMLAEPSHSSFESIRHSEYLFYRDQKLSDVGAHSVSPSGKFAIYQDGPSGNLFLFRRADRKITQLTRTFIALAASFDWHEAPGTVDAHLERKGLKTFTLQ